MLKSGIIENQKTYFKMKNTITIMIAFFVATLVFGACDPTTEPSPIEAKPAVKTELVAAYESTTEGQNFALTGDTTLPQKTTPLHPAPTSQNVSTLKGTDGSLRYVAIGASLTAGVRDGGWFNEGMATSYPNLIARQMGIKDFKQPLFNEKEYNGYGLKLLAKNTETPINRYKAVGNNIAFKPSGSEMILSPYEGAGLDNFAVPNLLNSGGIDTKYFKLYYNRMIADNKQLNTKIVESKASFFTLEYLTQDLIIGALTSGAFQMTFNYYPYDTASIGNFERDISFLAKTAKIKQGVVLNTPNIINFPYFKNSIRYSQIKAIFDKLGLKNKDYGYDLDERTMNFHSPIVDSLFKYQNDKTKFLNYYLSSFLKHNKGMSISSQIGRKETIDLFNTKIHPYLSKKYNYPIVDIYTLYDRVNSGTLMTEEGLKVTDKEFFSSDGIYPSAYGQALIANECIKTMNTFYKTNVPLIKASYYLSR
jgi:lysophospholipase L1-like esterase